MVQSKYTLDGEKLKEILATQNRSQEWLSRVAGYGNTWVSDHIRKCRHITEEQANTIAYILGVEKEEIIVAPAIALSSPVVPGVAVRYSKEFADMYVMLKKLLTKVDEIQQQQEALYNKLNTVVKQNCRIQDAVKDITKPNTQDAAVQFLRDVLKNGRMRVSTIKEDASGLGISQNDLMAAKKRLNISAEVSGYGANKETYWYM